jgi:hypothetical protein
MCASKSIRTGVPAVLDMDEAEVRYYSQAFDLGGRIEMLAALHRGQEGMKCYWRERTKRDAAAMTPSSVMLSSQCRRGRGLQTWLRRLASMATYFCQGRVEDEGSPDRISRSVCGGCRVEIKGQEAAASTEVADRSASLRCVLRAGAVCGLIF